MSQSTHKFVPHLTIVEIVETNDSVEVGCPDKLLPGTLNELSGTNSCILGAPIKRLTEPGTRCSDTPFVSDHRPCQRRKLL